MSDNVIPVTTACSGVYTDIPGGYALGVSLGANIKKYRKAAALTQEQLGEPLGLGQGAISKWESGETSPAVADLPTIARIARTSLDRLLQGVDAQYDASRDLTRHGSTRASTFPKGEPDDPAAARIRELEARLVVYKAVIRRSQRLAQAIVTVTGRGEEGGKAPRRRARSG